MDELKGGRTNAALLDKDLEDWGVELSEETAVFVHKVADSFCLRAAGQPKGGISRLLSLSCLWNSWRWCGQKV